MARRRRNPRRRAAAPDGPPAHAERHREEASRGGTATTETNAQATADEPRDARREPTAPAGPGRRRQSRRRRWLLGAAAAAVAGALIAVGAAQARRAAYAARLPALPELAGQPPALREHLEAADRQARDRPTSADAVGTLGLAYHADLFLDRADRAYAAAEALDGGAWRWTYYRALAGGMRGDTETLAAGMRRVTAAAPDFGPAWWRLGEAEFKAGRYEEAAEAWRRARTLPEPARADSPGAQAGRPPAVPLSAYGALGLARVALVQGDAARAAGLLEDVTAAAPGFGPAFRLLGDAYATLNRAEDSARAVRTAARLPRYAPYPDPLSEVLERESRSTTFLLQQAAAADLTTDAPRRERLIRRALEVDPDHAVALAELATQFRVLRRYDEALELLERRRRRRPDDFGVLADMGRSLAGLRRYDEAEQMLRRALEGLDNAATRYELGTVLDRAGRLSEAVAEYRLALDRNPNHVGALNNLGAALAGQGRTDEAIRSFERLIAVDPENADARANLGLAFAAAGAQARAATSFREALRLDPDHEGARDGLRDLPPR